MKPNFEFDKGLPRGMIGAYLPQVSHHGHHHHHHHTRKRFWNWIDNFRLSLIPNLLKVLMDSHSKIKLCKLTTNTSMTSHRGENQEPTMSCKSLSAVWFVSNAFHFRVISLFSWFFLDEFHLLKRYKATERVRSRPTETLWKVWSCRPHFRCQGQKWWRGSQGVCIRYICR